MKKKKVKLRDKFGYVPRKVDQEINNSPSMTVQGDTLSVSEMLLRLSNGIPMNGKSGVYFDEENEDFDADDLEKLRDGDILERQEAVEGAKELDKVIQEELNKKVEKKKTPEKEEKKEEAEGEE